MVDVQIEERQLLKRLLELPLDVLLDEVEVVAPQGLLLLRQGVDRWSIKIERRMGRRNLELRTAGGGAAGWVSFPTALP